MKNASEKQQPHPEVPDVELHEREGTFVLTRNGADLVCPEQTRIVTVMETGERDGITGQKKIAPAILSESCSSKCAKFWIENMDGQMQVTQLCCNNELEFDEVISDKIIRPDNNTIFGKGGKA